MHPRNRHSGRYDFPALIRALPGLAAFTRPNPAGEPTIDFADPAAVLALNRALLRHHYGVADWQLPAGYLCPPIPGRVDYLHHLADLLTPEGGAIPRGPDVRILDIGTGANAIYPLLGAAEYGWSFVGTETDGVALRAAQANTAATPALAGRIEVRPQSDAAAVFAGVIKPGETFAATLCNPPFHASAADALAGTTRKVRNLGGHAPKPTLNFGGRAHELWCPGGEAAFIMRLIRESAGQPGLSRWFTTLISKRETLPVVQRELTRVRPEQIRVLPMAQGQKQSRILAWTFQPPPGR